MEIHGDDDMTPDVHTPGDDEIRIGELLSNVGSLLSNINTEGM